MIDLCVVNYNSIKYLWRLWNTLVPNMSDRVSFHMYVADNGSTDGSVDLLKQAEKPPFVDEILFNENIGYAAACNQLAALGDSEYIGLLNADVWMTQQDLDGITRTFEETGADIIGPKQRDENGTIRHAGIFGSNTAPKHRGWRMPDPEDKLFRDRVEAVTVSGSAYFVRRSVWEALTNDPEYKAMYPDAIGAFLPTPHYYEETWCSYFARHRGYTVLYDGTVSMGHTWHASSPVRGGRDNLWHISQKMFRDACDAIGIERD